MLFHILMVCDLLIPVFIFSAGRTIGTRFPEKPNPHTGFLLPSAMKNRDTWKFAHILCGKLWRKTGIAFFLITALAELPFLGSRADAQGPFRRANFGLVTLVLLAAQTAALVWSVFAVQRALEREFAPDGTKKSTK